jgi:hypothetical protein
MNKTVNNVAVRTNGKIIHEGNSGTEGLGLMPGDNVGVGDGVGLEVVVGLIVGFKLGLPVVLK